MSNLESVLRGGAITLLILLVILLVRDARRVPVARFAVLYAIGVAAYMVVSASAFVNQPAWWLFPLRMLGAGNPVIFWLLAATLFDDEFVARPRHLVAWIGMVCLGTFCLYSDGRIVHAGATALSLFFNFVAIWYAVVGKSEDLVELRRKFRMVFMIAAALYSIIQITAEFLVSAGPSRTTLEAVNAGGLIVMVMAFCIELLAVNARGSIISLAIPRRQSASASTPEPAVDQASAEATKQDENWLVALRRIMEKDKIYREEALSVATLADKLRLPDYRLRRLINQKLGYRNFTAFLNDYRLADVMAALSAPERTGIPVLTIALEAGFQSIGPCNRAFKAHTGLTPTEFRQRQLAKAERRSAA